MTGAKTPASFPFRMAWRETRASWARLLFFFLCVSIGVAAIVALRSVMQHVRATLTREARFLVGGDIVLQTSKAWTDVQRREIATVTGAASQSEVIETQTMGSRTAGPLILATRLVEVRAVDAGFPYYGTLELADGQAYSHELVANHGALVQPQVLEQLGVTVGGEITLAGQRFTVRGVVTRDRVQRSGGLSLGPRVYVDLTDLRATSLLGFGSRAAHKIFLRLDPAAIDPAVDRLTAAFQDDLITVRSWHSVEDRLGRNLTLAENYLSLVGFAIVVLGGIGVWSVTRVFVQQKVKSVAILKCLGATSNVVLGTYVLQVGTLAACGSLLGVALGAAAIASIPARLLTPIGVSQVGVTASAAAQGVAVGLLVSLLFALVPLLEMRHVKPLLLLRADTSATARRRDMRSWLTGVAIAGALMLVAVWQADSLRAGLYVSLGLAGMSLVLLGVSRVLVRAVAPLTRSPVFAIRHAVISLGRPGNQTRVVLLSVGIGCFFILTSRALQANLMQEFTGQISRSAPDLVLIDVQPNQVAGVIAAVSPYVSEPPRMMPMMRARVVGVAGRRVTLANPEAVRKHGKLTREFGITFRDTLQDNETVTGGTFWRGALGTDTLPEEADTEVSIEQNVHDDAGVDVGDLMRFDIGGRAVRARVTSIRKVTWDEAQNGGFVFVLRPGPALDRAPHTFIGFLQLPAGAGPAALERDLTGKFPNVSAIDVREVLASLREVIDNATLGVTIVGAVMLFGGVLILVGAVAMTKFQRLYEAAIYRTLGASTRVLAGMAVIEYGIVGLLAGVLGALGALLLSWAAATRLFEIDWHPATGVLLGGVTMTALLVGAVGLLASADVFLRKPLGTLRRE